MAMLITGLCYEEHGDCSELKREFHIKKKGLKYIAYAFRNMDFEPINNGRFSYKRLLDDIQIYKQKNALFYQGYESKIFVER